MKKYLWISVLVIVLDQITKYLASSQLDYAVPVAVMPMFNFTLLHNTGAAFSFLSDAGGWQRWFFVVLALVISIVLFVWLTRLKQHEKWIAISLSLILGGAIGNVIDRFIFGYVIDFLDIYYNNWHWPAFNIADSAITVGAVVLILEGVLKKEEKA
ncbi:MAG: signal peptidase II [Gammaproteobacteria bacterium]|nr:signal peptidase II [Gammaproteobacteria bacterium]